jgi:endonuclease/exonuclease/phosphatase family metal-dependent hydrolase
MKFGAIVLLMMAGGVSGVGGAQELRVLTYNIHHGEGMDERLDLDRIVRVIQSEKPDIVCLQEIDRNLPRTDHLDFPALLSRKLGMTAVFEPNYRFDGGEYGNATLTSLKVLSHENHPLPNPKNREPRGCLRVTVEFHGREIEVWNTHLGLDAEERAAQGRAILDLKPAPPCFLAGDMNEDTSGQGMRTLLSRFKNALATVPGKRKQIDYVLVSEDVHVLSSRILDTPEARAASDHLPCLAVLEINPPPAPGRGEQ